VRPNSRRDNGLSPPAFLTQGSKSPPENPRRSAGGFVKVQAFAKINLFLDVLNKRPDGYHNIFSIMQSVDLCDDLKISVCKKKNGGQVHLICSDFDLPTGESNLVVKAASFLLREFKRDENINIVLFKRIPVGAGLAGGSSDCAATLHGINKLLDLQIPFAELLEIGKSFGADVPFCLTGGTALTEGIGEIITPLAQHPDCFIVIACPRIHVSTSKIFNKITPENYKSINNEQREKIINNFSSFPRIAKSLFNFFTPITAGQHPEIYDIMSKFRNMGAVGTEMSGTGSSVFAYFENKDIAVEACDIMKRSVNKIFICKPI
jgi:4-diphosphocytidyl-2-C-methyl-D-erythritol kinase